MLLNVEIENYRALRSLNVELRPLTVLVGVNDSGKSSFLKALLRLSEGNRAFDLADCWRRNPLNKIFIRASTESKSFSITNDSERSEAVNDIGLDPSKSPRARTTVFPPTLLIQLPTNGVEMQSLGYSDSQPQLLLDREGSSVPSLLDYFLRKDRNRFFACVDQLKTLVPGLVDILIETPEPAMRRLDLRIENDLTIEAREASAGVRLLIFFVALAFHPTPPKLILLEEPETGIHPKQLADVMNLLRSITRGELGGNPAQVIMTTHSPYLLDLVDLETDQALVFERNDDGSCSAKPADRDRLKIFLDEFMLGEVWFNQGEEGLVARR